MYVTNATLDFQVLTCCGATYPAASHVTPVELSRGGEASAAGMKKIGEGEMLVGCWLTAAAERRTPLPAVEARESCDRDSCPPPLRREREGQLRGDIDRFTPSLPPTQHTHIHTQNTGTPVCPPTTTATTPQHRQPRWERGTCLTLAGSLFHG